MRRGADMTLSQFQKLIEDIYFERDNARGALAAYAWLNEEVGEVARAIRSEDKARIAEEIGDVLAWTASLASILGVDIEAACTRFADGCPKCGGTPCHCPED